MRLEKAGRTSEANITRIFGAPLRSLFVLLTAMSLIAPAAVLAQLPAKTNTLTAGAGTARRGEDETIRPFRVHVPQAALDDLHRRIAATRWPDQETVTDRSQGVQLATMKEVVRYWQTDYDWRKAEAKLNALSQFVTKTDGVDIHFIHVKSRHPEVDKGGHFAGWEQPELLAAEVRVAFRSLR